MEQNTHIKLLIVDDSVQHNAAMMSVLKIKDVEVHSATTGNQALSMMLRNSYALLLVDVNMPEMDGIELVKLMREHPEMMQIPVIFITGEVQDKEKIFTGYEAGAVDYLLKPFDPAILLSKVKAFVQLNKNQLLLKRLLMEKEELLSRIKDQNKKLSYLACHDSLTMTFNRNGFERELYSAFENSKRYKRKFAVLLMDIDHFKVINDVYGHDHGDMILQEVAVRLKRTLRKTDYVARMGGDEFAIILSEIKTHYHAGNVAEKIIQNLSKTFNVLNRELRLTVSIGIACFPNEAIDKTIFNEKILLRNADIAMFRAKQKRNNTYEFYTAEFSIKHRDRLIIENNLKFASERKEFFLSYQPKVEIDTSKVIGFEALLRWQHPEKGVVLPGQFIPIMEETQMIVPVGEWIMRQVFERYNAWQHMKSKNIKIAINISAFQLVNQSFPTFIHALISELNVDPTCFELELTETAAMNDLLEVKDLLFRLSDLGFAISIDDFGTGYSMLSYLKKLPIRSLKIDLEFIRDVLCNESSEMIVRAIISLAKNFNLEVIAEGVETSEQASFLLNAGCRYAQGYLYSQPLLESEVDAYLSGAMR